MLCSKQEHHLGVNNSPLFQAIPKLSGSLTLCASLMTVNFLSPDSWWPSSSELNCELPGLEGAEAAALNDMLGQNVAQCG